MSDKTYRDVSKCPAKHRIVTIRRVGTAGRVVRTYCMTCRRAYQIKAGPLPASAAQAVTDQAKDKP
jgi:hypothetical protein